MKLLILSDLHAEFELFEVPKGLDYDLAILAGDIVAPGRFAARWLRNLTRFGGKPIVQIAGNHEYYESVAGQDWRGCNAKHKHKHTTSISSTATRS